MPVITISRQMGSRGEEIAQVVARQLNYEYMDKNRIAEALRKYGLQPLEIETFDEKKPPFWDYMSIQRKRFLLILQALIYELAGRDDMVIVGRGGQVLLKGLPGVLHVRIVAPFVIRIERILEGGAKDPQEATGALRRSDRESSGFIRGYFDLDWQDPDLYDLIINTQSLSVDAAARIILESFHSFKIQDGGKRAQEKLADLTLVQKAEASLLVVLGSGLRQIKIEAEKGVVHLEGRVPSAILKEDCQGAIARIKGVARVENRLSVSDNYGHMEAIMELSRHRGKRCDGARIGLAPFGAALPQVWELPPLTGDPSFPIFTLHEKNILYERKMRRRRRK
jgi:cytidylate kinase